MGSGGFAILCAYDTHQGVNMRTNVEIDDKLLAKAMKKTGAKTKREVIQRALTELVKAPPDYSGILELFGKGVVDPSYDPKNPAADLVGRKAA